MRNIAFAFLSVLLLTAQDCEAPQPQPEPGFCNGVSDGVIGNVQRGIQATWNTIIGGQPADERYATVHVEIIGRGSCTGTIVGPHTVITAGHCSGGSGYRIRLRPVTHWGEYYTATSWYIHQGYYRWSSERGAPHDDIQVLWFDDVELPEPYAEPFYNADSGMPLQCTRTFAQGWGQYKRDDAPPPDGYEMLPCPDGANRCLQEAEMYVLRRVENNTAIDTQIPYWGGICFGDSGGPMYAQMNDGRLMLAGITSTTSSGNCVGYDSGRAHSTHVYGGSYKKWYVAAEFCHQTGTLPGNMNSCVRNYLARE